MTLTVAEKEWTRDVTVRFLSRLKVEMVQGI